jgi:hypothetical protein
MGFARSPLPRFFLVGVACASLAGCSGSATIRLTPLNFTAIDPPAPRVAQLTIDECYWWEDAAGQIWIAMQERRAGLFTDFADLGFQLSLRLEQPPAGAARNYLARRDELRARVKIGPVESRLESTHGIVALYREGDDRYRGTFRLRVHREVNYLLGGWSRPTTYLLLGEFTAVQDAARGQAIANLTESAGWDRAPVTEPSPVIRDHSVTPAE